MFMSKECRPDGSPVTTYAKVATLPLLGIRDTRTSFFAGLLVCLRESQPLVGTPSSTTCN